MSDNTHQHRPNALSRFTAWLMHHLQSLVFSLGKAYRSPSATLMTVAVIAITLTLPSGFYLLLKNIQTISGDLRSSTQISLFLDMKLSLENALQFNTQLQQRPDIATTQFISRTQALTEFKQSSGFGKSLDHVKDNPLPHTIIVSPASQLDTLAIKTLLSKLESLAEVDIAKLDTEWLEKLFTIVEIAKRSVIIISLLFSFAVLLIIGNTIRLDIQNRYQEIVVTKLIGATNAFIRRPFLYSGVWYGLFGGLLSWLIIELSILVLSGPFDSLNLLYQSQFTIISFSFSDFLIIICCSTLLGLAGSWLAVARHLNEIEPK
ncbi:MAG: cell division protein FtsX [Gammaproteobacteria bacterium]|nr:cell division protein FtsX [Gammaproteobacteria bacterium]MBL6999586.1 cell division protein FtsX [Gammaproteobacteria bacterium]